MMNPKTAQDRFYRISPTTTRGLILSLTILLIAASLVGSACNGDPERSEASAEAELIMSTLFKTKEGEVIATTGGAPLLTVEELREKVQKMTPFMRRRLDTPEGQREIIDQLIHFEILAREAARKQLHLDPKVQQALKQALVSQLHSERMEKEGETEISDERLREYYEENISDFVRPERVRLSHIFFASPSDSSAEHEAVRKKATERLAQLRAAGENNAGDFNRMARNVSDDGESRSVGGDLRFYRSKDELEEAWGRRMAEAAFELEGVGTISEVVEGDKGFHILRLVGRQRAIDRKLEDVRPQLISRARRDERKRNFDEYVEEVANRHDLVINEDLLERLDLLSVLPTDEPHSRHGSLPRARHLEPSDSTAEDTEGRQ